MAIHESAEMYLETILLLSRQTGKVRSIDISEHMHFSKPSVSRAVGNLKKEDCINVDGSGYITLTEKGLEIAEKIYEKHRLLTEYLIKLGVNEKTAENDACNIEHVISDETFNALKKHFAGINGTAGST